MTLAIRTFSEEKKPLGLSPTALFNSWLPTLDNLRNLFLRPTTEMVSFLQQVRETA